MGNLARTCRRPLPSELGHRPAGRVATQSVRWHRPRRRGRRVSTFDEQARVDEEVLTRFDGSASGVPVGLVGSQAWTVSSRAPVREATPSNGRSAAPGHGPSPGQRAKPQVLPESQGTEATPPKPARRSAVTKAVMSPPVAARNSVPRMTPTGHAADYLERVVVAKPCLGGLVEFGDLLVEGHYLPRQRVHQLGGQLLAGQAGVPGEPYEGLTASRRTP
jgi:hypothetical protein